MTPCPQLAGGQFLVTDIEQEQGLHTVQIVQSFTVELILDHVKQLPVEAFHQLKKLKIFGTRRRFRGHAFCHRHHTHSTRSLMIVFYVQWAL